MMFLDCLCNSVFRYVVGVMSRDFFVAHGAIHDVNHRPLNIQTHRWVNYHQWLGNNTWPYFCLFIQLESSFICARILGKRGRGGTRPV